MSHLGGVDAISRSSSPGKLKRKRESPAGAHLRQSPSENAKGAKLTNSATTSNGSRLHPSLSANGQNAKQYRSPDSDEMHQSDSGDLLHGVGSASSLTSTGSSLFSHNSQPVAQNRKASRANGLTPLTDHTDSSPPKTNTPPAAHTTAPMSSADGAIATASMPSSNTAPARKERPSMFPPIGTAKGYRAVWDPDMDGRLSKEERKRASVRKREFGTETYEPDPPPDPRLAIPGYMSGNCRPKDRPSKAILRPAPYNVHPYKTDRYSVGPGEPQQVVAVGFDPFLSETALKLNFGQYGSIASVQNKTDPSTGSFLGIALVKYRDSVRDGQALAATESVKRAEAELNGHRIGLHTLKVESDREGRKCKRYVESALKRVRDEREKDRKMSIVPPPPPPPDSTTTLKTDPPGAASAPFNAPKGPSGRPSVKPPEGPRSAAAPTNPRVTAASSLIEEQLILNQIKRKPYIHIPHSSVPVLGTTIPHLKKRLKAYDWREVRLDHTGYYVVFEDSKRGEDETERCFAECNKAALFTYNMEMECQRYGNPNYERSPSPERVMAAKKTREEMERLKREEAEDLEIEKKNRAENLDPVLGALEQLRTELRDKIMSDIKTRIAIPIFHESLDPAKHTAKRRKLGLSDPSDNENRAPSLLFSKGGDTPPHTPRSRFGRDAKPLRPHDPNQQRGRRGERERERDSSNVFLDERRRRPVPRPSHARGLHFRLQQIYDEEDDESDDERKTTITRDTEDQESRPLSRASRTSTPAFDSDSVAETPRKRRKPADWEDEENESFDPLQKQLLGHLLHKEPEDLATRELELVVGTLPRSSKYATRARTELYIRQRSKADDDLFQVQGELQQSADGFLDDSDAPRKELEATPSVDLDADAVKEKAKKKRKTKKQILEEQEALKAEAKRTKAAKHAIEPKMIAKIEQKDIEPEGVEQLEQKEREQYVSYDKPRRTVEDDRDVVLDVDGWQHIIKDDEDLALAKKALNDEPSYDIGDAKVWAWKQKEIKALNGGIHGPASAETGIEGYYVPNPTGCARTEGVKKILNEEKSKYLPHRIKVQKAREERQAQAKANPTAAAEAAKIAAAEKIASTATSRSNRVNNRRLVNDINLQKQTLATANSDADVAIRFNQLKKRKKLVKFDRSAIHGWGLYAEENIAVNDLIIEYVGEKVRQKVADMRELKYEKQGVGSSYLFRMMDDEIVDATKKGGIARFINHSCNPNCTAKIIKVEGTPRIVIYALKDIGKNDELTYDYKFEREYGATDRIPCLCGSANCKGFLN